MQIQKKPFFVGGLQPRPGLGRFNHEDAVRSHRGVFLSVYCLQTKTWIRPLCLLHTNSYTTSASCRPIFSCPSLCPPRILGSRREEGATGEGTIFEVMANTPFIPTIRPGGVRRELAVVDPHGRFVRWLANKP